MSAASTEYPKRRSTYKAKFGGMDNAILKDVASKKW